MLVMRRKFLSSSQTEVPLQKLPRSRVHVEAIIFAAQDGTYRDGSGSRLYGPLQQRVGCHTDHHADRQQR